MSTPAIDALVDWLIDGAPGAADSANVFTRIGEVLHAGSHGVVRMTVFLRTLHPTVAGRAFRWSSSTGPAIDDAPHGLFESELFHNSPVRAAFLEKAETRIRFGVGDRENHQFPIVAELLADGCTDYVVLPLVFTSGQTHAITFGTRAPGGFTDEGIADLRRICRPLARIAEIMAQRHTASTLLSTYVGRNSGGKILAGRIQKGDYETVRAVIWFSDLRGFTELSSRASTREVIDTLNAVFECQVPAIENHGGEVLKFMGDGLLAIFPLAQDADDAQASKVADDALAAADEALAAVAALAPLRIGLALHVGDLAYGNIGSASRLDFTAIGAAVNLTSRLEALTSKLGKPLVVSAELARLTTRATEELGTFDLKGIAAPARVFAPRA